MIKNFTIKQTHMSFILPIGYDTKRERELVGTIIKNKYKPFQINDPPQDVNVYGEGIHVNGKELEQYFLPFVERKLFPPSMKDSGFHRFIHPTKKQLELIMNKNSIPFFIQSMDIILGPFGIAFLNVRVQLSNNDIDLSDVLTFMHYFRVVESKLKEEQGALLFCLETNTSFSIHDLLFKRLCPFLENYIVHDENLNGYFGSLPYFTDERMYVSAFLFGEENTEITNEHLYRMGALDGRTADGKAFISATNQKYIDRSVERTLHDRWAPHTYTIVTEHAFLTITNHAIDTMFRELSQHMGTHYYNFLLHYFYKIMLLRVAYEYSEISWEKDEEYVKSLIKLITLFSSLYFFQEVSTRSEGKELSKLFRKSFNIDSLFQEVNHTLRDLYQSQKNSTSSKMNMLLFILTVFTVISGIYGMNLVIKDWEHPFGWKAISTYTVFEWISLLTALSGIGLSCLLVFITLSKRVFSKWRQKKSKSHVD